MTSPTGSNPRGLTLIEILISVAILASAAVLIMQALAKGAYSLTMAQNRMRAYTFAAAKLADVEMSHRQGTVPETEGSFQVGRERFQWRLETAEVPETTALEQVTLHIDWRQGGHTRESRVSLFRQAPKSQP